MLWRLALATFSRLDSIVKNEYFAFYGQFFFILFEFSLDLFVTIHCLPCLFLFQNHSVHTQIFIFFIFFIPFHQSSSKGMGSISFSICVTYLVIYHLDCVFLFVYLIVEYGYLISDGFGVYFWWLCSDSLCSACIMSYLTHTHKHTHCHDSDLIPMNLGLYFSFLIWASLC